MMLIRLPGREVTRWILFWFLATVLHPTQVAESAAEPLVDTKQTDAVTESDAVSCLYQGFSKIVRVHPKGRRGQKGWKRCKRTKRIQKRHTEFLPYLVAKVAAGHELACAAISAPPPDAALDGGVQEDGMQILSNVVGAIRIDYDSLISRHIYSYVVIVPSCSFIH